MNEGNFSTYEEITGISLDNIFPSVPTGLMATISDGSALLNWDEPVYDDFQYFTVFRDSELLVYTVESTYTDDECGEYEYYITATDANGNESGQSESIMLEVETLVGDINVDCAVNIQDILIMINAILEVEEVGGIEIEFYPDYLLYDISGDGIVNIIDVVVLINIILER